MRRIRLFTYERSREENVPNVNSVDLVTLGNGVAVLSFTFIGEKTHE